MVGSYMGAAELGAVRGEPAPAEPSDNNTSGTNSGPMAQQGAMGAHGHEMYPQAFVRLIGCHEAKNPGRDAAHRLHA